jgi:hypothetical protein
MPQGVDFPVRFPAVGQEDPGLARPAGMAVFGKA